MIFNNMILMINNNYNKKYVKINLNWKMFLKFFINEYNKIIINIILFYIVFMIDH